MARRPNSARNIDSEMKLTAHRLIDRLKKIGVQSPTSTSPPVLDSYRQQFWPHVWSTLQSVVGQPATLVSDEGLFRRRVVDRGWAALPDGMKKFGRAQLCWDELLLTLRREVYKVVSGRLTLRPDAPQRITAVLAWMVTPLSTPNARSAPTVMSSKTQCAAERDPVR
jgi:hypothetical protein